MDPSRSRRQSSGRTSSFPIHCGSLREFWPQGRKIPLAQVPSGSRRTGIHSPAPIRPNPKNTMGSLGDYGHTAPQAGDLLGPHPSLTRLALELAYS